MAVIQSTIDEGTEMVWHQKLFCDINVVDQTKASFPTYQGLQKVNFFCKKLTKQAMLETMITTAIEKFVEMKVNIVLPVNQGHEH